jgi:hypothetical protein
VRRPTALGAALGAAAVSALVLLLQVSSEAIPPLGAALRDLPLIPILLVGVTLVVTIRTIRSR